MGRFWYVVLVNAYLFVVMEVINYLLVVMEVIIKLLACCYGGDNLTTCLLLWR